MTKKYKPRTMFAIRNGQAQVVEQTDVKRFEITTGAIGRRPWGKMILTSLADTLGMMKRFAPLRDWNKLEIQE